MVEGELGLNNILRWMFQNINEISITGQVKIFIY
jgi:hypothetical protein